MLCVKNGNVHDAIHEEAYRADILVEDGRIKAIGEHLETEEGVQIVEAEGLHVYPGFVEAHGHIGLSGSARIDGQGSLERSEGRNPEP